MPRTRMLKTRQLRAKTEDGRVFDLVEMTRYTEVVDSGWWTWVAGEKSLALKDGTHVDVRGEGVFEVLPSGPLLRCM